MIVASGVINLIFFTLMLWIKELRAHPMKLFMLLLACDGSVLFNYGVSLQACDWGLPKLLAWTIFFNNDCESVLTAVIKLSNSAIFGTLFFSVASVCLNICVCIDLILTIKRPFKAKEPRMPRYYAFTFLVAIVQAST